VHVLFVFETSCMLFFNSEGCSDLHVCYTIDTYLMVILYTDVPLKTKFGLPPHACLNPNLKCYKLNKQINENLLGFYTVLLEASQCSVMAPSSTIKSPT
jgi:hypothetical protein